MNNNLYIIASKIAEILSNAIVVSLLAVMATYWFNECSAKKRQKEKKKGLLRALIADRKRAFVIPDKDDVANYNFTYLPVSYSYWTVYESRCAELGIIDNHELIDRIIRTYVDVKGLFENLKDLAECTRLYAREVLHTTIMKMLAILQRDFKDHQIIIASIYDFNLQNEQVIEFENGVFGY